MFNPIKILTIELTEQFNDLDNLNGYQYLWALIKFRNNPLGYIKIPVSEGKVSSYSLIRKAVRKFSKEIINISLTENFELISAKQKINIEDLLSEKIYDKNYTISFTVAVCTRNRTNDLEICLNSLLKTDYNNFEIIVVDNAPDNNLTEELVKKYPSVKYIHEPYPGLDWARNRAIKEASGEVIAFTDDDVVVDSNWLNALAELFENDEEVMAATGLVLPYEIETEAQFLFEKYGGFGRGFKKEYYSVKISGEKAAKNFGGSGKFGTGANMAFRKNIFEKIGFFDPALDVGTVTNGGGDLEMFFRVIKEGYLLVYEPKAIVFHRHRKTPELLKVQLTNNGIGFYSYLVRSCAFYPEERASFILLGLWWFYIWSIRRLIMSFPAPHRFPRSLIIAELTGSIRGLTSYRNAQRNAYKTDKILYENYLKKSVKNNNKSNSFFSASVIVDLYKEINISDSGNYQKNIFIIKKGKKFLGKAVIENNFLKISERRFKEEITRQLNLKLFSSSLNEIQLYKKIRAKLYRFFLNINKEKPDEIDSASIIIATYDRPYELYNCLTSLRKLKTNIKTEIIVVDNNPSSGKTTQILSDFPEVLLLEERRKGLSFARNKGFRNCRGEIAVSIDDDVIVPEDWLDNLLSPFKDKNVMAVTGNVLPFELKTRAENLFEIYGGLGRGFKSKYYDSDWFYQAGLHALPTWEIGATANAAFRTEIFTHPEIGLLEESLGAGTPTGCSEDTYFFYKILKAGFTIIYQPKAYLWHKHRKNIKDFKKQLFNYSKGHVAYNLLTYLNDKDARGIFRLVVELPFAHISRIIKRISGKSNYPVNFVLTEIFGNIVGPVSLYFSKKRIKKQGELLNSHSPRQYAISSEVGNSKSISQNDTGVQIRNINL